jgi:hypothetical protein
MVSCTRSVGHSTMKYWGATWWLLAILVSGGCQLDCGHGHAEGVRKDVEQKDVVEKIDTTVIGEVRVGKELPVFYVAYGFDSAVLGFSVSTVSGPVRYFPLYASTDRGIPSVVLEVFASRAEDEMWVRSSWKDNETLAYHRVGAETTLAAWGEMRFIDSPMPDHLSGGPLPFPQMPRDVVRKAVFKYDQDHEETHRD